MSLMLSLDAKRITGSLAQLVLVDERAVEIPDETNTSRLGGSYFIGD
jgi:hypothetical protein